MGTKKCSKCNQEKPLDAFYTDKRAKDGKTWKCKECDLACQRSRYASDPFREKNRRYKVKTKYGISLGDYDALLESQGGVCALCGTDTPGGRGRFNIDHDHQTGKIRGVLCSPCNLAIGLVKEDTLILYRMIDYLEVSRV